MPNPVTLSEWQKLQNHFHSFQSIDIKDQFANDANRFESFSLTLDTLLFDFSKNPVIHETLSLLIELAKASKVEEALQRLQSGQIVNLSENRPALHTMSRDLKYRSDELHQMEKIIQQIYQSEITDIVNIGIGGSDLGPSMVCEALQSFSQTSQQFHFVSTLDTQQIDQVLKTLNPKTTLFIVSSKSFTTQETIVNFEIAKKWAGNIDFSKHFIAITANSDEAKKQGFHPESIFTFDQAIGGRYSIWSSIGLTVAIKIGMNHFREFLDGGQVVDSHVINNPLNKNVPVIMALLNIWLINFYGYETRAILPYDTRLSQFPNYLQQLEMESNGKSVRQNGEKVTYQTGPIIWGGLETNGQHAFHQLLHQGSQIVPTDFIMVIQGENDIQNRARLFSHGISQSRVMMMGGKGQSPHQDIPGNRANNMIILPALTPRALGILIALYEYKVFISSVIWETNPFDQYGVEMGKTMANQLFSSLQKKQIDQSLDSSTQGLMRFFLQHA